MIFLGKPLHPFPDHAPFSGRLIVTSDAAVVSPVRRGSNPALTAALLIAIIAAATLCGAWYFQYFRDIQPCPLCLEQRYAYYLAIPLAVLTALAAGQGAPRTLLIGALAILALATLGNAVLGTYHAGVEWKFWAGPADCTGTGGNLGSAGTLLEQLDKVKVVMCDQVQWTFLGISLAGYNALISLLMAVIALWGVAKSAKQT
jgi:disulfide bond formation protein DsbB